MYETGTAWSTITKFGIYVCILVEDLKYSIYPAQPHKQVESSATAVVVAARKTGKLTKFQAEEVSQTKLGVDVVLHPPILNMCKWI